MIVHAQGLTVFESACGSVAPGEAVQWLQSAATCPDCIAAIRRAEEKWRP